MQESVTTTGHTMLKKFLANLLQRKWVSPRSNLNMLFTVPVQNKWQQQKTSPADKDERIHLSGTKVRAMLREGKTPPPQFSRPKVAEELARAMKTS